ncbi:MAG TPA: hypothetical protein PLK76_02660, partial [bacterium]|nr:hypothetical protein [bacterium]
MEARRQPPQSGGLPRRKTFFTILILRATDFPSKKEKKVFSARLRADARAAGLLNFARGQKMEGFKGRKFFARSLFKIQIFLR